MIELRAIAFKRIQGGRTFLKMQGTREGLSDNYVMRVGGPIEKYKMGKGPGVLHGISILKIEAKTIKNTKCT